MIRDEFDLIPDIEEEKKVSKIQEDESDSPNRKTWSRSRQIISGIMRKHIYKQVSSGLPHLPLPRIPMEKATLKYVKHMSAKINTEAKANSIEKHVSICYRKEYKRITDRLNTIERMVLSEHPRRTEKTKKALIAYAQMSWSREQYRITEKKIKNITRDLLSTFTILSKKV